MNNNPYIFLLLVICFSGSANASINLLSTFDYNNLQVSSNTFPRNFVGVTVDFSQIYATIMNTTLFQGYFSNSKIYGSSGAQFSVSLTFPKGYKYNCSAYTAMGINSTCIYSYQPIMTRITQFCKNVGPVINSNLVFGFDMEGANFSNPSFVSYFYSFVNTVISTVGSGYYTVPIELVTGADSFGINNISANYTISNYISDMDAAMSAYPTIFYGPGISQNADPSWLSSYNTYQPTYNYAFSVKCSIFKSRSNFTIEELLEETNYRDYLINRFTTPSGTLNMKKGNIMIQQMKLSDGNGINGVTNTFAAALWALDISIEFALLGGGNIKFPIDVNADNYQSVLGPAPSHTPNPIYYGLLFLTLLSYVTPFIGRPQSIAGSSSNIKAYGFSIQNQLQVILINKDTNPNASGVVKLLINVKDRLQCLYLTGGSLNATTNITFAGFSFIGGNSTPQGSYSVTPIDLVEEGVYHVPLAYAQAAICYLGNPAQGLEVGVLYYENLVFTFFTLAFLSLFF